MWGVGSDRGFYMWGVRQITLICGRGGFWSNANMSREKQIREKQIREEQIKENAGAYIPGVDSRGRSIGLISGEGRWGCSSIGSGKPTNRGELMSSIISPAALRTCFITGTILVKGGLRPGTRSQQVWMKCLSKGVRYLVSDGNGGRSLFST